MPSLLASGGPSKLEWGSVGAGTRADYARRLASFDLFCDRQFLSYRTESELEAALLEYLDEVFVEGFKVDVGTKLIAALRYRYLALHRAGFTDHLLRARRAIQGWTRLQPCLTSLPVPLSAVAAVSVRLEMMGFHSLARVFFMAADAYMRPEEAFGVTGRAVLPSHSRLGKLIALRLSFWHRGKKDWRPSP